MTTFDPIRTDLQERRGEQPRAGYVLSALCLLAMVALTVTNWPDMAEHLTESRRPMLFEPHKALGNAIAPVCLLIVAAILSLAPTWSQRLDQISRRTTLDPPTQRRSLNIALCLTALTLLAVHAGLVAAYLGHDLDPAQLSAWCTTGVTGFIGLMILLRAWPAGPPAPGVLPTGAVMALAAVAGAVLSIDHALVAIVITSVVLAVGVTVVVMLHARGLTRSGEQVS